MIVNLNERVEATMEKQGLDFLAAYRHHMHHVQKDLEAFKKKMTEQEYLMKRSDRIAALEKELEWYQ